MRIPVPSFRMQIIFLVLFLVINFALFFRNYFLDSFQDYSATLETLNINENINQLYRQYESQIDPAARDRFKQEIEELLITERQMSMARDMFQKEIALYSKFIFVFLTLSVLILFFISFNMITRPLNRLQAATNELTRGNWTVQVKESRFSPLNDLIRSFNSMIMELEANRNKLVQAEKESAWREMARVLAHEIKNPLTPIRLSLERLEQKYLTRSKDLDQVFRQGTAIIFEEINNLQSLASEFSQFARLPEAHFTAYDLNDQLREIAEPYQDQAQFELDLLAELPSFNGDKTQMKQVFTNLIQNGIQSSSDDGRIDISTFQVGSEICVDIADNGTGIRPEDLGKIFDPYFSKREKGTGLGLAIVKRIVENHSGTINVKSEPGKGTLFTLSFRQLDNQSPKGAETP